MSTINQSREAHVTETAKFWQDGEEFWTRCNQRSEACHSYKRAGDFIHELMNYRPHQADY